MNRAALPPRAVLVVAPPLVALAVGLAAAPPGSTAVLIWAMGLCTLAQAGLAAWLVTHERRLTEGARRDREALVGAQAESEALAIEVRRLRGEVDVLAASREIGLVVNADNEFDDVLAKVLKVVEDLLRADTVTLFLRDPETNAVRPVARRAAGAFSTLASLSALDGGAPVDRTHVAEALAGMRLLRLTDGSRLALTLPLAAEGRAVGVLRAELDLGAARQEERAAECERALQALERHLALAIKAPTLYDRAVRDGLTGLYSRRHLDNQLVELMAIARRTNRSFALFVADVDHFKKVNDGHGHQAGDQVLREVSAVIRQTIRAYDTAYRYGGEELVVLMPDTALDEAVKTAERVRKAIEKRTVKAPDSGKRIAVTASFGVAQYIEGMDGPRALIEAADRALYRAKEGGRNRVESA